LLSARFLSYPWPSADRASESDVINAACKCTAKNDSCAILDHVPEVLRAEDYSVIPASDRVSRSCTGASNKKHTAGQSIGPSINMSKPSDRPFLCDPTTSTSHVSGSGDQSDTASEVPINDAGDITIGDTTPHAAEHATHHLNRSTPPPANTARSTQPSSTPFSKNVSGNAPNDRRKDPLYSLLENDTKNPTIIVFKNFLDPETLEHLAKFNISLKKSEVEHYQPFTIMSPSHSL